ncbi:MAG: response regulator transcription factor [bacterium]|nr:response regulator transcription factor [Candidatus Margulisiibacteriota bacterium]
MKILLIEDEKKVARFIVRGLKEQRYSVDHAATGLDGEYLASVGQYDLIILDLKLPDKDGLIVCKTIRKKSTLPVLMLTARDSVKEKVAGLDAGADDYLVKPFAFAELLARIRALTRRSRQLKDEKELKIGELRLDLLGHRCFKGKKEISLTSTEYKVLELFMRRPKELITRTTLYEQVWGIDFDTDTNLTDVYVNKLKNKIDPNKSLSYFKTIRGSGYVFTPL